MDLLQCLDDQWSNGGADVAELLKQIPAGNQQLAIELCAADLEWRWRLAKGEADKSTPHGSHSIRSVTDYKSLIGDLWSRLECRRDLYEAEWSARSLWGDEPDVDEFASQLPSINGWNLELARQIDALEPLAAVLGGQSLKRSLTLRVSHQFVIGRQGSDDPPAPGWSIDKQRLIVANSHYRMISREQLQVRRTRVREIELANLSHSVPFQYPKIQLQPGQSTRLTLPIAVKVGEVNIQFLLNEDA